MMEFTSGDPIAAEALDRSAEALPGGPAVGEVPIVGPLAQAIGFEAQINNLSSYPRRASVDGSEGDTKIGVFQDPRNISSVFVTVSGSAADDKARLIKTALALIKKEQIARVEYQAKLDDVEMLLALHSAGFSLEGYATGLYIDHEGVGRNNTAILSLTKASRPSLAESIAALAFVRGISDDVVGLNLPRESQIGALYEEHTNKENVDWGLLPPLAFDTFTSRMQRSAASAIFGNDIVLAITDDYSREVVGRIAIRRVVPPNVADVGYGILPRHRGRGLAARALNLLSEWSLNSGNFSRLELGIKPGNFASKVTAERGGFVFEGMRQGRLRNQDGSMSPELHYSRTR